MFRFVNTSTTGIVETFGKFTRTTPPGLNFYVPIFQRFNTISNRLQQNSFRFDVKTKDDVFARVNIAVQYKVEPENAAKAYYSLSNPIAQMDSYIENSIRGYAAKKELNTLFEEQDSMCKAVNAELLPKMRDNGFTIMNTLVTEIEPAAEVKNAMNHIYASERLKVAAKNEADAEYIKQVRTAEADAERKRLQGEGISQQRTAIMDGYRETIGHMRDLGLEPTDILKFVEKVQHLDTMEAIGRSNNAKTIFMDNGDKTFKSGMLGALEEARINQSQ